MASFVDVAVSSVPHLIRPVTAGFLATASRTRDSQVPWTSAQNTGAPSSSLNPRKDSLSNASGSSSVLSSSAGAFTSFSLASAGANRTPGRESSGSTSTTSARPDTKGRRMARGSSAAARTASVSARSSDARSASERAKNGTPSGPPSKTAARAAMLPEDRAPPNLSRFEHGSVACPRRRSAGAVGPGIRRARATDVDVGARIAAAAAKACIFTRHRKWRVLLIDTKTYGGSG